VIPLRLVLALALCGALSATAAAGKVSWKRWTPPTTCTEATSTGGATVAELVDATSLASLLPGCTPHVRWTHHRLIHIDFVGDGLSAGRIVSVRRHGRTLEVRLSTTAVCTGARFLERSSLWLRIPAGTTATNVTVIEVPTPSPKRCRVP
jgi:hypothetical protein